MEGELEFFPGEAMVAIGEFVNDEWFVVNKFTAVMASSECCHFDLIVSCVVKNCTE